jgi:hypothetical protein
MKKRSQNKKVQAQNTIYTNSTHPKAKEKFDFYQRSLSAGCGSWVAILVSRAAKKTKGLMPESRRFLQVSVKESIISRLKSCCGGPRNMWTRVKSHIYCIRGNRFDAKQWAGLSGSRHIRPGQLLQTMSIAPPGFKLVMMTSHQMDSATITAWFLLWTKLTSTSCCQPCQQQPPRKPQEKKWWGNVEFNVSARDPMFVSLTNELEELNVQGGLQESTFYNGLMLVSRTYSTSAPSLALKSTDEWRKNPETGLLQHWTRTNKAGCVVDSGTAVQIRKNVKQASNLGALSLTTKVGEVIWFLWLSGEDDSHALYSPKAEQQGFELVPIYAADGGMWFAIEEALTHMSLINMTGNKMNMVDLQTSSLVVSKGGVGIRQNFHSQELLLLEKLYNLRIKQGNHKSIQKGQEWKARWM